MAELGLVDILENASLITMSRHDMNQTQISQMHQDLDEKNNEFDVNRKGNKSP